MRLRASAVLLAIALSPHAGAEEATPAPTATPAQISERLAELEAREQALAMLEQHLEAKVEELRRLRELAAETIEPAERERQEDVARLVAFYQAMKPKSAATLLEKLPRDLAADVLGAMKARDAGKILNVMQSEKAVQISKRMAGQE